MPLIFLILTDCKVLCKNNKKHEKYRIYSREPLRRSFNFRLSKGGAYLREAFFRGRRSLYISKDIKLFSTCLINQTIRTVRITKE